MILIIRGNNNTRIDVMSQFRFLYRAWKCFSDNILMSEISCHFFLCVVTSNVIMKCKCETRHFLLLI